MDGLVSIIVPVYNAENYIRETISCVAAQTYGDWELLLVEDGSADDTPRIIQSSMEQEGTDRIRLIRQPSNMGAARARNRGLGEARGGISPTWTPTTSGCRRSWSGSCAS